MMIIVVTMLLAVSCQRSDIVDRDEPDTHTGELRFSPGIGEAHSVTRAGESDNDILRTASAAGENLPHIVIKAYTGTPESVLTPYFADELGYFKSGAYWDINSGIPRFLPKGGMSLYAYFATDATAKGDLTNIDYLSPTTDAAYPKLTYTVAADATLQTDLIAAKVEHITQPDVAIPFRHLLSQINFGVKGIEQHQITIKNIRINKVIGHGTFDYGTWQWTTDKKSATNNYTYYFPDRKKEDVSSGQGGNYKTSGALDDSQNSYIFGDGGKFGPGKEPTFRYAQVNPTPTNYTTAEHTLDPLNNSLILMPQEVKSNADASVTFDYEITLNGENIRSGVNNVVRLDAYHDWMPNYRYVYIFKFDDPQKVTFDVLVEPWQNYNDGDGIVDADELNSTNLFLKHVKPIEPGKSYSVPLGPLSSDFICDWSLYMLNNSFTAGQQFSLSFDSKLPFEKGKSIIINPPFGFSADATSLTAPGKVTFTATLSYFSTSTALNSAISSGSGNHEFNVSDAVKLNEINFTGSSLTESSLMLHYLTAYSGPTPPQWQFSDKKTWVYYPNDYALTSTTAPYSYTIYTTNGLKSVFDWMNNGGNHPGGSSSLGLADRLRTNITLAAHGKYDLAEVYKASASVTDTKPAFIPIGNSVTSYTGNFDGKGATISNLYINSGDDYQGFFGDKRGTVQNLNLAQVSVKGRTFVGGIAGLNGGGNIINCSVSGRVENTGNLVGGIAGSNWSYIIGCGSSVTIYGGGTGGIAGSGGFITACYSTGDIIGFGSVGGIAAEGGTIKASYSTSTLTLSTGTKGAIIGNGVGTTSNCYYVAASDMGSNPTGVIYLPSIAALNGKIPQLNEATLNCQHFAPIHFVSGNLNSTSPTIAEGAPAARQGGGILKGTFIQNWFALGWDQSRWDTEMATLATIGMEYLVIDQVMEYSVYDPKTPQYMTWYPATPGLPVNDPALFVNSNNALELCMKACRAHNIRLFVGTFFDKRYWDGGAAVTGYAAEWDNCITTANRVMDDLTAKYFHGGASSYNDVLAGWYFPYEVDDFNFQTEAAQTILKSGISKALAHRSNNATANMPYLFSPFMNGSGPIAITGTMDEIQYAALWGDIIRSTGFRSGDILSPQDCIGIGKLTIADLSVWMPALRGAVSNGVEFWVNVELFGPGGNVSALLNDQIPASKPYAQEFISFSYPIDYSPNVSKHNIYKAYYDAQ